MQRRLSEADERFMREIVPAEEDRHLFTSTPWRGEYRWFRAANVFCFEQYRRVAAASTCEAA
jgi:hypothetical protein